MRLDAYNEFCDNVSVAAVPGTALLGNVIPLSSVGLNLGTTDMYFVLMTGATEIITAGSAGTITFKLVSDAQEAIAVDGSATVHLTSATLVTDDAAVNSAALNAGGQIIVAKLPHGTYEEYLGVIAVIGSTEVTAGTVNAFLTPDVSAWKAYADGL